MDSLIAVVRLVHIAAGFVALVVAPVAMLTVKGGPTHRRWGKVYFWTMAVVALTAVVLAAYRPVLFLALVAVFSFYAALSAYRVLFRKRPEAGQGPRALDWAAALITLTASVALVVLGIARPGETFQRLGTVAIVFGVFGLALAGRDIVRFARPPADRNAWWFSHMTGMLGSYIAVVSAFSVVNFTSLPTLVRWLWPTVVGTPLIVAWVVYYRMRFARRKTAAAAPAAV
ncbi:MAG TPA: DUF2306 domain-containing protein [Methylomirabilota bacterium]|jgi:uncharacterized membrane protein|nr:DUF2306 domain-containing protein [Methylomirabilota bacterium]